MIRPAAGTTVGEWVLEERLGVDAVAELWRARHRFLPEDRPLVRVPTSREGVEAIRAQGLAWHAAAGPGSPKVRGLDPDADPPYLAFEPAPRGAQGEAPRPGPAEPIRFVGEVGPPPPAAVLAASPCGRPAACGAPGRRLPLLLWPFALPLVLVRGLRRCAPVAVPLAGVGLLAAALFVLGGDDVSLPRPAGGLPRTGAASADEAEILRELDRLGSPAGAPRLTF
ncbi:MAG: hypothetical protein L0216_21920, partial [Planctomycetales bacterium]|nr:hypothetical protein [Planctomycetales bacterium]